MRKTLYVKDDDYRLSFLHGNFVTLTNLTEEDWARLAEQRLSPLNVSVHATDLDLRRRMLVNDAAPDIIEQLRRLGALGLQAHTQIVLCPGVNDGPHLERSVRDLAGLYPTVQTISVVPVGASPKLEDWSLERDHIELVRPTAGYARQVVSLLRPLQEEFRQTHGATIVHCSDEYYVTAAAPIPSRRTYDGFPQYENGIGMVRTMLDDWAKTRRRLERPSSTPPLPRPLRVTIATATLIAPSLREVAAEFAQVTGAQVDVVPVTNTVFGERVNVSGLLCGKDYARELAGRETDLFILPRPSLDYFGRQFLDSMSVQELESQLSAPVAFASLWSDVAEILASGAFRPTANAASNGVHWS
jgi:putative radical SAM enzyme (TIGR03279 family)